MYFENMARTRAISDANLGILLQRFAFDKFYRHCGR